MWNLEKYAENIAVIKEDKTKYTYMQLHQMSDKFAEKIGRRCLVFLECRNTIESLAAYVGMVNHKIVPLMLGTADMEKVLPLVNEYLPEYICLYDYRENIKGYMQSYCFGNLNIYKKESAEEYGINDELALLLPTSGTTGSRKYVRISYENLLCNTESIIDYLKISEKDRTITSMPMSYTYGLSIINTYLYSGAGLLLTERNIIDKRFWNFFEDSGGTSFSGVPYAYEVLGKIGFFNKEHRNLKTLTQAGGRLRVELQKKIGAYALENNIHFFIMYGQTEATARMTYLSPGEVLKKPGSVGKPIKGGKIEIVGENEEVLNDGETGEIIYKGKNVSMGYATGFKELDAGNSNRNVLKTGDTGYKDKEGYLYITGRTNRYGKISGFRINLYELENCLSDKYGIPFKCMIEDEKLIVKGQVDRELDEEISEAAGINKRLIRYEYVKELPRNENGKM